MGDWGGDESDGSLDLKSAVVEPEYRRAERPEEVQTRVSETLEAMMLLGPAFSGDASVSAEHLYATCSARACFFVASKVMQTKRKTLLVVWTMDDFEVTGYPPPEEQLVIPMVLLTFPPLLKLVWQNRVLNLGMDDTFPDWSEVFHTQVHLDEAWQLLVRWPRSIRHLIQAKANEADFRALVLSEMYKLAILEMEKNASRYAEIGLEIGASVFHRLMRRCTDPVNLGPRPYMKNSAKAYRMEEGEARELFDQVFRTQIPRVMHELFCIPQYTGWEDETNSGAERCGLFPRQREHANQVREDRREVNRKYDTDLDKFLKAKIRSDGVKTLPFKYLDQFVANRRRNHGDFDERPAFRRRAESNQEPRLDLNLVEREDLRWLIGIMN